MLVHETLLFGLPGLFLMLIFKEMFVNITKKPNHDPFVITLELLCKFWLLVCVMIFVMLILHLFFPSFIESISYLKFLDFKN